MQPSHHDHAEVKGYNGHELNRVYASDCGQANGVSGVAALAAAASMSEQEVAMVLAHSAGDCHASDMTMGSHSKCKAEVMDSDETGPSADVLDSASAEKVLKQSNTNAVHDSEQVDSERGIPLGNAESPNRPPSNGPLAHDNNGPNVVAVLVEK